MLNTEDYMKIFHEIKNSVTLINSYLQLVEKKNPQISNFDYWESSKSEVARLRTVVTELSQIRFGDSLQLEHMDLKPFLAECSNSFHSFDGTEQIFCMLSMPEHPCVAAIDAKQLRHAILNLLKNSCEAMEHHGTIQLSLHQDENSASICITDSGGGIAPDVIDHIFDPFITTKSEGSGLGLSITKQIITAHHGSITVESQKGIGSTFTILLPLVYID